MYNYQISVASTNDNFDKVVNEYTISSSKCLDKRLLEIASLLLDGGAARETMKIELKRLPIFSSEISVTGEEFVNSKWIDKLIKS